MITLNLNVNVVIEHAKKEIYTSQVEARYSSKTVIQTVAQATFLPKNYSFDVGATLICNLKADFSKFIPNFEVAMFGIGLVGLFKISDGFEVGLQGYLASAMVIHAPQFEMHLKNAIRYNVFPYLGFYVKLRHLKLVVHFAFKVQTTMSILANSNRFQGVISNSMYVGGGIVGQRSL